MIPVTERMAASRARKRAAGLKQIQLWTLPECEAELKRFNAALIQAQTENTGGKKGWFLLNPPGFWTEGH
jgi:hypothetical protein